MFLHDWAPGSDNYDGHGLEGLKAGFEIGDDMLVGVDILLASYSYENYYGDAFVLFKRDGKLWEVNASHCSCYGLEGQWEPEETSVESIERRISTGRFDNIRQELAAVLAAVG